MAKENITTNALHEIYQNLQQGKRYGEYCAVYSAFFSTCLIVDRWKRYIHWQYYGSSANKNTIEDLEWVLNTIFRMTPEQFIERYSIYDEESMKKWEDIVRAQDTTKYRTWKPGK